MQKIKLNGLVLDLNPSTAACTVLRDGQVLDFSGGKPMDVAQGMARRADTLVISGRISLLQIICGLIACGLPIKQAMLVAVNEQRGAKFQKLNTALAAAIDGDQGRLRLLFQQLLEPRVVIEPVRRTAARLRGEVRPSV